MISVVISCFSVMVLRLMCCKVKVTHSAAEDNFVGKAVRLMSVVYEFPLIIKS